MPAKKNPQTTPRSTKAKAKKTPERPKKNAPRSKGAEQWAEENKGEYLLSGPDLIRLMFDNKVSIPVLAERLGVKEWKIRDRRFYGIKDKAELTEWKKSISKKTTTKKGDQQ